MSKQLAKECELWTPNLSARKPER